jgi:hypothetical protein
VLHPQENILGLYKKSTEIRKYGPRNGLSLKTIPLTKPMSQEPMRNILHVSRKCKTFVSNGGKKKQQKQMAQTR